MTLKTFRCFLVLSVLLAAASTPVGWAQLTSQAQIAGLVTDQTGASVPEVNIKATNTATNVVYSSISDAAGAYTIPNLVPGPYKVTVSKTGFKTTVQTGIVLNMGAHLSLNFILQVGQLTTTVEVSARGQLLTTEEASYSTTFENQMITALPQISRATLDQVAALAPAIQGSAPATLSTSQNFVAIGSQGIDMALAGGQRNGVLVTVDGVSTQDLEDNNVSRSIPTPDAVGEFRVQTGVLTADVSRYSGGVITLSSQSGTKDYHGRLFYYGRNQHLNSNDWMNNALSTPDLPIRKSPYHQNNYGLALGGPLSVPKVYNGKERTFFYFSWENEHFTTNTFARGSVPTPLEQSGNFSQSIINYVNGQPVYARIFDPYAGSLDAQGNWVRPEFANATIPPDKQVKATPFLLGVFPLPNHAPDANTSSTNNYWGSQPRVRNVNQETLRLDHTLGTNHRFFAHASRYHGKDDTSPLMPHSGQYVNYDHDWAGGLGYTWSISPTSIFEARLGISWNKLLSYQGSPGSPSWDTRTWSLDPMVFLPGTGSDFHISPYIGLGGPYSGIGGGQYDNFTHQTYDGSLAYTKVWNRHTFKFGYQGIWSLTNETGGDKSGMTNLSSAGGTNQYWNNDDGLTGHPLAALMLGSGKYFNWGNWVIVPTGPLHGGFVMDDWKVNTKLTLQLGLRYDYERGRRPRYPYGVVFDMAAKSVRTPNADWSWSQVLGAVPELANYASPAWLTSGINGRTCLINTPECPQQLIYTTSSGVTQPRIGVSYALDSNTVLHGSFGSVFQSFSGFESKYGGSFYYPWDTYNQVMTIDEMHWVSEIGLDHGLGAFPLQPDGSHLGYTPHTADNTEWWYDTFGGPAHPSYGYSQPTTPLDDPKEYVWGVGVQRKIGNSWVASAEYQGIHGVHLMIPVNWASYQFTNVPPQYYSLGSHLSDNVPNPFVGQSLADAAAPQIPLSRLLTQMPQYSSAGPQMLAKGHSLSHFLNLQMQTRNYHGLMLLASYTIRKTLVNNVGKGIRDLYGYGNLQNPNDLEEMYSVATYEVPQSWLFNYYYELPVGRGRHFMATSQGWGGRVLDAVIGGWGVAGVTNFWPKGTPVYAPRVDGSVAAPNAAVRWSVSSPNYYNHNVDYGRDIVVSGVFQNPNPAVMFNKSVYVRTPDYSFGNLPDVYPNVRNPGGFSTNATAFKNFYFSENRQRYLNFRVEGTNFFNHPTFNGVDADPDSPTFGGIFGKSGYRVMQIGARLFF